MTTTAAPINDRIKTLAITLQRQKTFMETTGLQTRFWDSYWKLSEAIWSLEGATGLSASELRDQEDESNRDQSR